MRGPPPPTSARPDAAPSTRAGAYPSSGSRRGEWRPGMRGPPLPMRGPPLPALLTVCVSAASRRLPESVTASLARFDLQHRPAVVHKSVVFQDLEIAAVTEPEQSPLGDRGDASFLTNVHCPVGVVQYDPDLLAEQRSCVVARFGRAGLADTHSTRPVHLLKQRNGVVRIFGTHPPHPLHVFLQ